MTKKQMEELGWERPDFVLVTGDAYIDHPSFGTAIIGRVLERAGYKVAVISQPHWNNADDFKRFGRPRLGFLINSGTVDSMVANYTVNKKRRREDSLSPGGTPGLRPDRAVIVYTNRAKEAYKDCPVIIGGIEASLRRLSHFDYWDNKIRRSILLDSKADILAYGMGEKSILEIAEALNDGFDVRDITWVCGTAVRADEAAGDGIELFPYEETRGDKELYLKNFKLQYENNDYISGELLYEKYADGLYIKQNTPQPPLMSHELDRIYELPYMYDEHPMYKDRGGIPALHEIRFSIASNRGCFGNCAFCAITSHQGRVVTGRSKESIVKEAELMTAMDGFKGYIHDIGGPTANFHAPACKRQTTAGTCKDRDCIYPEPCESVTADHGEYLDIIRTVRTLPKVKKVFIRSGIRYDYIIADKKYGKEFVHQLCMNHVSGTLKVAPEHVSPNVLKIMRKPDKETYGKFSTMYFDENKRIGKKQYLIPYFISSHPGARIEDALELAIFLKESGFVPDQIQDFYPTPGTLSTAIYYGGRDPLTGENVYVPRSYRERKQQRALLHFNKPQNKKLVIETLKEMGRSDLITFFYGRQCEEKFNGRKGKKR